MFVFFWSSHRAIPYLRGGKIGSNLNLGELSHIGKAHAEWEGMWQTSVEHSAIIIIKEILKN